jgi:transcriptional regulator with XRE-family HTH domain
MLSADQIRAARALMNWSQSELAKKIEMSVPSIGNIESGKHIPSPQTQDKIIKTFALSGVEFIEGGARHIPDIVEIIEDKDCYLYLLDDVYYTLKDSQDEVLFWAADESRSTNEVIEKTKFIRKHNIPMRFFICEGDTYCMGNINEYRWLKKDLYVTSDVKVIYANKVAYLINFNDTQKILLLKDANIAKDSRRVFNFIWELSTGPSSSSADAYYEERE